MGVYLPNMEIPTGCSAIAISIWSDGQVEIINAGGEFKTSKAIFIPPHGRLGDLDALKERITKRLYSSNHGSMAEAYYAALIDLIDTAPTIIPAEEGET